MFSFFLKQIRGTQKIVLLSLVCLSNLLYLQTWQVSFIFYIKRHFFIRFLPSFPWTQKMFINFITIYKLELFVTLDYHTEIHQKINISYILSKYPHLALNSKNQNVEGHKNAISISKSVCLKTNTFCRAFENS